MRSGLAAILVSTVLTGAAVAADLAPAPAEPVAPATPYNWTGLYAGLHAGYGRGREKDNQSVLFPNRTGSGTASDKFDMDGFAGGAHAGYNYQLAGGFVVGLEGDIDYADMKGSQRGSYAGGASLRTLEMKSEWQGSIRARVGYTIDNILLYATGGVAFADGKLTNSGSDNGTPVASTSSSKAHLGWTIGLGAEYAFTRNWIGRLEARHSDFQNKSYQTSDGPVKAGWNQTTVMAGGSYRF